MSGRESREREQAKQAKMVDKLLAQLGSPEAPGGRTGGPGPRAQGGRAPLVGVSAAATPPSPLAVWTRVGLALLLGVGITQWPYARECGWPLLAYASALVVVLAGAVWASVYAWRAHMAVAHVGAQLLLLWGLVLASVVLLPRVGYARHAATWVCRPAGVVPTLAPLGVQPPVRADSVAPAVPADSQP